MTEIKVGASRSAITLVLGYSNGCACYIPTRQAFAEGGYEPEDSFRWYGIPPLAPSAGDAMAAAATRMLAGLHSAYQD